LSTLEEQVILSGESTLSSVIDSWIRLSSTSVKFAFNARLKSWTAWQKHIALRATLEKRRNLGQASLQDLAEQDGKVDEGKREFMDISRLIKFELLRFDEERMEDFRLGLVEYVEGLYKKQVDVVNAWSLYGEVVQQMIGANVGPLPRRTGENGTQAEQARA
jgi:sorting nexin-1/2